MDCLLTITILTYNSGKYVADALKSVGKQAKKSIQLIISDDHSSDDTVHQIKSFIQEYEGFFYEIIFLENSTNVGILENKKRTFQHIKGSWVKGLAGDDLLHPDAIETIEKDIEAHPLAQVIIGQATIINIASEKSLTIPNFEIVKRLNTLKKMKSFLFEGNTVPAICFLVRSELFTQKNYFKHAKKNFEDVPFHLELLRNKILFHFTESQYILYRKHDSNMSRKKKEEILSVHYLLYQKILLKYAFLDFRLFYVLNSFWNLTLGTVVIRFGNKGEFLSLVNKIKVKLQPKRIKNMLFRPF